MKNKAGLDATPFDRRNAGRADALIKWLVHPETILVAVGAATDWVRFGASDAG